jgi:hypothetical protein
MVQPKSVAIRAATEKLESLNMSVPHTLKEANKHWVDRP